MATAELTIDAETRKPVFLDPDHPVFAHAGEEPVFIGLDEGRARFARDVSGWVPGEVAEQIGGVDHSAGAGDEAELDVIVARETRGDTHRRRLGHCRVAQRGRFDLEGGDIFGPPPDPVLASDETAPGPPHFRRY